MSDSDQVHLDSAFTYDLDAGEPLSHGIVTAVAAATGAARVATAADGGEASVLEPLYETIDPDALDAMFAPTGAGASRREGWITFTYHDHRVTARSDGRITVRRSADFADGTAD